MPQGTDSQALRSVMTGQVGGNRGVRVRIFPDASGLPDESPEADSEVITLVNPDSIQTNSLNTFTAPADTRLSANTTYHVVVSSGNRN